MLEKPSFSSKSETRGSCCEPDPIVGVVNTSTAGCCGAVRRDKGLAAFDNVNVPSDHGGLRDPQAI